MRLIDADKINFKEVFGGQSDFAKDLRKAAQELIDIQPTAFDKEKVIEELKSAENYLYVNGIRITNFKFIHTLTAIEIVEKGRIE